MGGAASSVASPNDEIFVRSPCAISNEKSLARMDTRECVGWLCSQKFPESFDYKTVKEKLSKNQVDGIKLSMITCRELRDEIEIKPLGWRKAILRVVRTKLSAEISLAKSLIHQSDNPLAAISLTRNFSLRKESHKLQPLPLSPIHQVCQERPQKEQNQKQEERVEVILKENEEMQDRQSVCINTEAIYMNEEEKKESGIFIRKVCNFSSSTPF
uniref:SAM domain-containing protein n=1 Tax=Aureoumbra lagunensis TaxID=44058 RepID=A0A7S3JQW2_9STRA